MFNGCVESKAWWVEGVGDKRQDRRSSSPDSCRAAAEARGKGMLGEAQSIWGAQAPSRHTQWGLGSWSLNQEHGELGTCGLNNNENGGVPDLGRLESRQRDRSADRSAEHSALGGLQSTWSKENTAPGEGFLEEAMSWQGRVAKGTA